MMNFALTSVLTELKFLQYFFYPFAEMQFGEQPNGQTFVNRRVAMELKTESYLL